MTCNCPLSRVESCPTCGSLNIFSKNGGWVECGDCPTSWAYLRPACEAALIEAAREMQLKKGSIFSEKGRRLMLGLKAAQEFLHQENLDAIPEDTTYLYRMAGTGLHDEARRAYRAFAKFLDTPTAENALAAAKYVAIGGMQRPY